MVIFLCCFHPRVPGNSSSRRSGISSHSYLHMVDILFCFHPHVAGNSSSRSSGFSSCSYFPYNGQFSFLTNLCFLSQSRHPAINPTYCQKLGLRFTNHDRPQLPATIVQLHSTTRPTSPSRNNCPAAFKDSTDLSCPQRSSSCILRLDRPQLPATIVQLHSTTQPTATCIKHLAVSPRLDQPQLPASNIQLRTSTSRPYQLSTSPI